MTKEERRLGTKDRRADAENSCMCSTDPWRFNHLKVVGDIDKISQEQTAMWAKLDGMVSVKMFGLFMTILTTILIAFCASMYDTNKQTLAIVTQINEKVITLEASRDYYGFTYPYRGGPFYGDKPSLVDSVNCGNPLSIR